MYGNLNLGLDTLYLRTWVSTNSRITTDSQTYSMLKTIWKDTG